jgi:acyl dehydratase
VATERHGGLIASGFHTLCVTARLAVEGFRDQTAAGVGIGLDELRWHRPVRPGDTLAARLELLSKRPSESRPETGVVREAVEATVDGDPALTYETTALVERRPDERPGTGADGPEER